LTKSLDVPFFLHKTFKGLSVLLGFPHLIVEMYCYVYNGYFLVGVSLRYTVIETLLKNATNVTICNTIDPPLKWNETRQIPCQRDAVGSIVRIRQQAAVPGTLALCEVEVYGTFGKTAINL